MCYLIYIYTRNSKPNLICMYSFFYQNVLFYMRLILKFYIIIQLNAYICKTFKLVGDESNTFAKISIHDSISV